MLAHELTHVVQQSGGEVEAQPSIQADRGEVGGIKGNKYMSVEPRTDTVQRKALPNRNMNLIQRAELATGGRKAGEALAGYLLGPENVSIKSSPKWVKNKEKMALKVTIKKERRKNLVPGLDMEGSEEETANTEAISNEVLGDLTVALRIIVNQDPDPDIVTQKLEEVRQFYDLKLLALTGVGFTGDNIEFNVTARGKVTDKEPGNIFRLLFDMKKRYGAKKETQSGEGEGVQTKPLDNANSASGVKTPEVQRQVENSSGNGGKTPTIQRGILSNLGKQLGTDFGRSITSSDKDKNTKTKTTYGRGDQDDQIAEPGSTDSDIPDEFADQIEGDTSEMDPNEERRIDDQVEGETGGETGREPGAGTGTPEKKKPKKKRKPRVVGFDVGVKVIPTADRSTVNMKVKAKAKKR